MPEYTPPTGNSLEFELQVYTPPSPDALEFILDKGEAQEINKNILFNFGGI